MIQAVWVEIPVVDLTRAAHFYETVFALPKTELTDDGVRKTITYFGGGPGQPGISLNQTANFLPGDKGNLIYFDAGEDMTEHLNRIVAGGGQVVEGKTSMGAAGFYAMIKDSEGNTFALYSVK